MFLFDRSFAAPAAGLAVALVFVCFDRACELTTADADVAPVTVAAAAVVAAPRVAAVSARLPAAQLAVPTSPACRAPAACGNLRAGS